jgi:glycosyltransferase involved in cell wall biosynthesis
MSKSPEISVVMGVFNNADTLPAALECILSQEGVDLEFIVVDDGSTDGSAAILDKAARTDARLKIVHKTNEGLTRALIDGCALASAPWIARQDADDRSWPGRLKAQLERANQPDAPDLVVCGAVCESPEGAKLYEVLPPEREEDARRKILEQGRTLCPHGAILMRADAYRAAGGYRAAFHFAQDLDLVTRLAERGRIATLPQVLYAFRFSPGSISGQHAARQEGFRRLLRACRDARTRGESETAWLEGAQTLAAQARKEPVRAPDEFRGLYFIGSCLRKRDPKLAHGYFGRAIRARPWSGPAAFRWLETLWRPADRES